METKNSKNEKMDLALDIILNTNQNLLLLGKAGTGKTTFLRKLKECCKKQMVVVAPTGIAAINAGGTTIHSFFRLPYSPFIPGKKFYSRDLTQEDDHNQVFITLELLVIDEISMVRADILDAIDHELRIKRNNNVVFGGVQLLLIGDLFQLPPVITSDDKRIYDKYYSTPFFFGSNSFSDADFHTIELDKVYRQENKKFINILNKLREGKVSSHDLNILNSRYIPDYSRPNDSKCIKLVTHNSQAAEDNALEYEKLETEEKEYTATIEGDFPESFFPVEYVLKLKVGSRVMFTRNDISNGYCNGTLGEVVSLQEDYVSVLTDDGKSVTVGRTNWENVDYVIQNNGVDEEDDIVEKHVGRFLQFPLRLAWSITVHKSQGLTFDNVILNLHRAFAPGQAYVALSRCRSLDGIVMTSKISLGVLKYDRDVEDFYNEIMMKKITNNVIIDSIEPDKIETIHKDNFPVDKNIEGHFSIPDGVTEIPKDAFNGCDKLTSVTIPNSVKSIDEYAFFKCDLLESIIIPKSVTRIEEGAFYGCDNLVKVEILNPEIAIEINPFFSCKKIQKPIILGKRFIHLPSNYSGVFDVPKGIEQIVGGAFYECKNLSRINIPDSVTLIGIGAFQGCSNLANIIIPNSVKSIEEATFFECEKLTNIELPNSITTIGKNAFWWCNSLISIEIPNSVNSIGELAFDSCWNLRSLFIPNSVTSIGKGAFCGCSNLTQIEVPEQLTCIPDYAFSGCANLSFIKIPSSIKCIGNEAFNGCRKLNNIKIPASVTSIGDLAFQGCSSLSIIDIPDSEIKIGDFPFRKSAIPCKTLIIGKSIVSVASDIVGVFEIPEGIERIVGGAFFECRDLVGVKIPDSVNYIGESAFEGCTNLTNIKIPNSVKSIKKRAFYGCVNLSKIKLPISLTVLEESTFELCVNLVDLTMPQVLDIVGNRVFYMCRNLTSIIIPTMLKEIGRDSFNGCENLTNLEVPPSVEKIGGRAFGSCKSLASFEIPNSIRYIEQGTFINCSGIQQIEIPESVTKIGNDAFSCCHGLTSVFIPKSISSIEDRAFSSCNHLSYFEVDHNNSNYRSIDGVLFSSDGKLLSYPCASTKNKYEIPKGTKVIAPSAFSSVLCLENIVFNKELELLQDNVFNSCRSLKEIIIPERIKAIPKGTMAFCQNLSKVYLHSAITKIEEFAFCGCDSLREVHICVSDPESVICNFRDKDVKSVTLFVPVGTGYAYRHHPEFSKFKEVVIERCQVYEQNKM